jgi:hypothetical protein
MYATEILAAAMFKIIYQKQGSTEAKTKSAVTVAHPNTSQCHKYFVHFFPRLLCDV